MSDSEMDSSSESPESLEPEYMRLSDRIFITSSLRSLGLSTDSVQIVHGVGQVGSVIVAKVEMVGADTKVEDWKGETKVLLQDDLLIGVLSNRYSTTSLYGGVPAGGIKVPADEPVDLLSTGGVMGICGSWPSYLGTPTRLHILGLVAQEGRPLNLLSRLHTDQRLMYDCPLVLIAGTAASVGKTTFATRLIKFLLHTMGRRVVATKLAGAGEYADLLSLRDAGAEPTLDFVDMGLPTTYDVPDNQVVPVIKGVLNRLGEYVPDVIVAELGGDILGASVPDILADPEIRARTKSLVLIPSDMLAAYGAIAILKETGFPAPISLGYPIKNQQASMVRARTLLKLPMFDCMKEEDLGLFVDAVLGWSKKPHSPIALLPKEEMSYTF